MTRRRLVSLGAFVLLAFIYAAYGIPLRFLHDSLPLAAQLAWMLTFGAIGGFWVFNKQLGESLSSHYQWQDWGLIAFKALTFYPLGTMLWGYGILTATYANVSFINALPLSSLVGALVLKERLDRRRMVAIAMGFLGVLVIAWKGSLTGWGLGEMAVAVSMVFYGLSYASIKRVSAAVKELPAAIWQLAFGAVMCWVVVLLRGELSMSMIGALDVLQVLLLMGGVNLLMIWLQNVGFGEEDVVVGGTLVNIETLFGILISVLVYAEVPSAREWLGGVLVALSAVILSGEKS